MSHRLQVLIPETLNARLSKAAQRSRLSRGEWVRGAIEKALSEAVTTSDPLAKLSSLRAPTADIEQMLAEIETGRS
jgi:metal-responsive CopG/Arc/MetJ family transcriptional regulator